MVVGTVAVQFRVQLPFAVLCYDYAVRQYEVELEPGILVVGVLQHNAYLLTLASRQADLVYGQLVIAKHRNSLYRHTERRVGPLILCAADLGEYLRTDC